MDLIPQYIQVLNDYVETNRMLICQFRENIAVKADDNEGITWMKNSWSKMG